MTLNIQSNITLNIAPDKRPIAVEPYLRNDLCEKNKISTIFGCGQNLIKRLALTVFILIVRRRWVAHIIDLDQTPHLRCLIWVCTVCSVRTLTVIQVDHVLHCLFKHVFRVFRVYTVKQYALTRNWNSECNLPLDHVAWQQIWVLSRQLSICITRHDEHSMKRGQFVYKYVIRSTCR